MSFFLKLPPVKYFTESLWRDEAFSWAMASRGLELLPLTARDFNPPLYYLLLNIWMRLTGPSEIALRSLSVIFFLGTLWVVWRFMIDVMVVPRRRAGLYLLLFALNPVLSYYAVEARMYSMLAFLAAASFYSYEARRPVLYVLSTSAGLYTHYFMFLVLGTQVVSEVLATRMTGRRFRLFMLCAPLLLFVPWSVFVAINGAGETAFWITPPGWRFALHVITAIYTGHDATYGFLARGERWIFALCLIPSVAWAIWAGYRSTVVQRPILLLVVLWALLPPAVVFGAAFLKPVFLARYLVFSSLGLLLLLVVGLERVRRPVRFALLIVLCGLAVRYQFLQVRHQSKGEYRDTIRQVALQAHPGDVLYVGNELDFFPAQYYFGEPRVFLFGRVYDEIRPYVGKVLISRDRVVGSMPSAPACAFFLKNDREFAVPPGCDVRRHVPRRAPSQAPARGCM